MEYPEAVVRQLRDRLARYHSETRINGRKRSWERVAEDMLDATSTPPAFVSAEFYAPLGEALRRFAAGKQVLTAERLDVLRGFLVERGLLTLTQTEISSEMARSLNALFGVDDTVGEVARATFEGNFVGVKKRWNEECEIAILRIAQNGDVGLCVEEEIHVVGSTPSAYDMRALDRFLQIRRRATLRKDGWLVHTADRQVLLVLRDRLSLVTSFCSIAYWETSNRAGTAFFVLMRQSPNLNFGGPKQSQEESSEYVRGKIASSVLHFARMEGKAVGR